MKNRASLMLMELIILMLVFSFASAFCVRVFVKSKEMSHQSEARDYAVMMTQSAAEVIRHNGGNFELSANALNGKVDGDMLKIEYDSKWNITDGGNCAYSLYAERLPNEIRGLGKARIRTFDENGNEMFSLDIMWQEADADE